MRLIQELRHSSREVQALLTAGVVLSGLYAAGPIMFLSNKLIGGTDPAITITVGGKSFLFLLVLVAHWPVFAIRNRVDRYTQNPTQMLSEALHDRGIRAKHIDETGQACHLLINLSGTFLWLAAVFGDSTVAADPYKDIGVLFGLWALTGFLILYTQWTRTQTCYDLTQPFETRKQVYRT